MEKTFIDWYLLSDGQGADNVFVKKILEYADNESALAQLNMFEHCLMVEVCLQKGEPRHIQKAKGFANFIVHGMKSVKLDPQTKNRIFDQVISMTNLDKE